MVQRDIIKDQIDQLGRVLSEIMGKFFGAASDGNVMLGISESKEALKDQLNLDLDELIDLDESDLEELLLSLHFSAVQMEQVGDYLQTIGEHHLADDLGKAPLFFQKSYSLYRLAGQHSEVYSMDRAAKETKSLKLLEQVKEMLKANNH